jgi:ATP-dependent DNA ligase
MLSRIFPAGFIEPCQPVGAAKPPSGAGWLHEIKHDGYRLMAQRRGSALDCSRATATTGPNAIRQ